MAMRITRRLFLAASAVGICRAQDPVFIADSRVVNLLASVRDADGKLIADLRKEEFVLSEDGKPLEIRYFSRETDLPLTVGLLIDTSASQFAVLERERRGAYVFLERVLRPDRDLALVMSFDARVKILCRPTAALSDMRKGLNAADLPLRKNVKQKPGREPKRKDIAGGTKLQTAVLECSDGFMLRATGRKAMLLLTDGVDEGSRTTLEQAIEHAQRADTVVYSIL
jgi:VWFA-related protein